VTGRAVAKTPTKGGMDRCARTARPSLRGHMPFKRKVSETERSLPGADQGALWKSHKQRFQEVWVLENA